MAQNNAINNQTQELTIDPGATGDSFLQFDINTTNEFIIGIDDDDGDSFKISQGGALGTNDYFIMTTDGERTMPLNPCFYADLLSDESNVTGSGTVYTIGSTVALNSVYDQGSNISSLNPLTFTAPVTGRYLLALNCSFSSITIATANASSARIVTSNRTYIIKNAYRPPSFGFFGQNMAMVADMDAADTAIIQGSISGEVSDASNIDGGSGGFTGLSGCLVS